MSFERLDTQAAVLIVDDQATARFLASETLSGAGFHVLEAENGYAALRMLEETKPDVILLDLYMPDMDGIEVCKKIRAKTQAFRIPILMVTGTDDEASIEQSYAAGATDFIAKPFRRYVLIQRVQALLRACRVEEDLHRLAYFDSLTSLANRASFHQHLSRCLLSAEKNNLKLSILYLDLDDFKRINDTLGHEVGDALLKEAASRLRDSIRSRGRSERSGSFAMEDMVARIGGDEFIILMPEIKDKKDASHVASRICQTISQSMKLSGYDIFVTCSIGIALYSTDSSTVETLLKHADNAMYAAKSMGKNNYRFYDESMNTKAIQRLAIDNELRHALARDEFLIHYQPQFDAYTGQVCGLEALLRWNNATLGPVSPADFIPVAEDNGLIVSIGEWILRTTCLQMKQWLDMGLSPSQVSVNISAAQFTKPEFVDLIADTLTQSSLDPRLLELEITESLLAKNVDMTIDILTALKSVGVQLAIDDFGTGYSSLSYLKKFPLDRLKIDRSFVNDISSNVDDAAIATAITSMAKSMRLSVIAEGVETEAQLNTLLSCGCREIQGYYFSRPLPTDDITSLLKSRYNQKSSPYKERSQKPTVLCLDCDPIALSNIASLIQQHHFEVYQASDTKTAFEILATNVIDIFVVDDRLPGIKGEAMVNQVQNRYPNVVSIMLSSQPDVQSLIDVVNGCRLFKFLQQPVSETALLAALNDAISPGVAEEGQKAA